MKTIVEEVYSPILDIDIKKNLVNSPIWKKAYTKDEITNVVKTQYPKFYQYSIKFKGLTPVQVNKVKDAKL